MSSSNDDDEGAKFPLPTSWVVDSCKEKELTLSRCEGDQRIHLLQASYERCIVGKQGCLLRSLSNEWILCIPPGALDYDQEITVSFYHVDDSYRLARNQFVTGIIEITPHQMPFAKPVELLLRHHLFIEDQKDEVTCTVLYHSGETDSEPLTGICYLSSKHERARPSDMTATLRDDFVYIEVFHFCRYGLECTGYNYITVWASMFAPECLDRKQEEHFLVRVSIHSQAPNRNDDEEKMTKEMLNLVRRNFCSVELDCFSKQPLQLKVQILNKCSGWKVQGESELNQTFPYNVIKDMMAKRKSISYDILFSKESGIDVTDIRPAFKFNETLRRLPPLVLSSKPSETQSGTLSNQEMSRTANSVAVLLSLVIYKYSNSLDYLTKTILVSIVVVLLSLVIYKYSNSLDYLTKTSSPSQQPKQCATEDESAVPVRMKQDDELDMTKHIDDKQILAISSVARNEWQEIGISLGFKRHELSGYEHRFRDDLDERLRTVLFAWKKREDNPTVGKVVEACGDAKVGAAVRRALQKLISGEAENS